MLVCVLSLFFLCKSASALHQPRDVLNQARAAYRPPAPKQYIPQPLELLTKRLEQEKACEDDYQMDSATRAMWGTLFTEWSNKKVLLAGDSLMQQFFDTLHCAVNLMGGEMRKGNVGLYKWLDEHTVLYNDTSMDPDPMTNKRLKHVAALIYGTHSVGRRVVYNNQELNLRIHYYRIYAFTEKCQHCNPDNIRSSTAVPGCGFCARESNLVSRVDTFVHFARSYDAVVVNLGHDMLSPNPLNKLLAMTKVMSELTHASHANNCFILLEHPPQHFPGSAEGNYMGDMNHTQCSCDLPKIEDQAVAANNGVMGRVASENSMRVAKIWSRMARASCGEHKPGPDCTHYKQSPRVWVPVVDAIMKAE